MELSKDIKTRRMQVWIEAWTRTSQSSSCLKASIATEYADYCLAEFDKRFTGEPIAD